MNVKSRSAATFVFVLGGVEASGVHSVCYTCGCRADCLGIESVKVTWPIMVLHWDVPSSS